MSDIINDEREEIARLLAEGPGNSQAALAEAEADSIEQQAENFDPEPLAAVLQALLISSQEPVDLEKLAEASESSADQVELAIKFLEQELNQDKYGFMLSKVAKGFQFRTKPQYARYVRTLKEELPRKLSPASLETLAIIAYRQPVVKHDIDSLRGVDVLPTLKTLMDRELVKILGHKETVGHPALYGTTDEFLRLFGLNSLQDLPSVKELENLQLEPGEQAGSFVNPLSQPQDSAAFE